MLRVPACHFLLGACLALPVCAGERKPPSHDTPAPSAEPPAPKEFKHREALASTEGLARELREAAGKLALIDARSPGAFEAGHIPGAVNIESDALQDPQRGPYLMPAPEVLKKICAEAGIHAASRVVVYDEEDGRLAARVWFTLQAYGHDGGAILDGGLGKWRSEGRALSGGGGAAGGGRGTFEPLAVPRGVCALAELPQFRTRVHTLGKLPPTTLLDARSLAEYMGEDVRAKTGGHIPGAANIEWSALLTAPPARRSEVRNPEPEAWKVWRSPPEIYAILRMAGVEREQRSCVYDQAGGRSAHLYFTLWLMGFEQVSNYVAGWREYGNRSDVEIER